MEHTSNDFFSETSAVSARSSSVSRVIAAATVGTAGGNVSRHGTCLVFATL